MQFYPFLLVKEMSALQIQSSSSMSSQEPDDGWPLRLLHTPSMVSLALAHRHEKASVTMKVYSSLTEDYFVEEYNALSYTWGRFEETGETKVGHVKIKGVPWNIPRIDPSHFTVADFERVISRIGKGDVLDDSRKQNTGEDRPKIPYLWLDIACIDQRGGPEKLSEIGRQAAIFRRAKDVYFWLSKVEFQDRWISVPEKRPDAPSRDSYENLGCGILYWDWYVQRARIVLERVLCDPWFESLWTLQEGFTCKRPWFLYREGIRMAKKDWGRLVDAAKAVKWTAEAHPYVFIRNEYGNIYSKVIRSGILNISGTNKFLLYAASRYRTVTEPADYFYGIQQVFDRRFGNTKNGVDPHQHSFSELEREFGMFLLESHPVESQLHLLVRPQFVGEGSCLSRYSDIPGKTETGTWWGIERSDWGEDALSPEVLFDGAQQDSLVTLQMSTDSTSLVNFSGKILPGTEFFGFYGTHSNSAAKMFPYTSFNLFVGLDYASRPAEGDHARLKGFFQELKRWYGNSIEIDIREQDSQTRLNISNQKEEAKTLDTQRMKIFQMARTCYGHLNRAKDGSDVWDLLEARQATCESLERLHSAEDLMPEQHHHPEPLHDEATWHQTSPIFTDIVILKLGRGKELEYFSGLILKKESEYWVRLGICAWTAWSQPTRGVWRWVETEGQFTGCIQPPQAVAKIHEEAALRIDWAKEQSITKYPQSIPWIDKNIEYYNKTLSAIGDSKQNWKISISSDNYHTLALHYYEYVQSPKPKQKEALMRLADEIDLLNFTLAKDSCPKEWGFLNVGEFVKFANKIQEQKDELNWNFSRCSFLL
ncbi:hypothetical protein BKA65DRAFT_488837 [Rhexocercosporidium sp. MPI-PUGE-AT-0058]|nr:hypothetical protein BKA65DRAFT_488837 [Rhexocercosporidium sp. MPI-PUGE-AT-0058]